jgi:Fe-S-cluster containining protein
MDNEEKKSAQEQDRDDPQSAIPGAGCKRCGTCCKKGGPAFHQQDRALIEKGMIHSKFLYTLRKGEYAYDNVQGRLLPVASDIIKIKGRQDTWACLFFDQKQNICRIYKNRPMECRALRCWDTRELESIYAENHLTRKDLMAEIEGLWGLIEDHQKRCDYEKIRGLANALERGKNAPARRELMEIIQYDTEIRKLVVAQGGLDAEILDFVFGRPLFKTIENFGWRIRKEGRKIYLVRTSR